MRKLLFCLALAIPMLATAQWDYKDSNRIMLFGGITSFDLNTSNFQYANKIAWTAGAGVRGNFYNNFDMIYSIQFFENGFSALAGPVMGTATQEVDFKTQGAQISLMPSYNIIYNHLSIEAGPVIQVNGKLSYEDDYADYYMNSTAQRLTEIENVSTFNFLGAVGVTAGIREVRVSVKYQYGFSNFLSGIDAPGVKYKAHPGAIQATLGIYF